MPPHAACQREARADRRILRCRRRPNKPAGATLHQLPHTSP